ncbi:MULTISPECIES: hypothetical protein [Terrabacteria group]|uniref:hypothetical protein n=1 Tax=Bacillati TaxID=1783272 RepID=UPI00193A68E1|nr:MULTISPECIES: hypothetical protein [Terrabacteria group]MBW9213187.1 hypothetical protein [Trueperella sp. zg.1013]QRG86917.1 hypothetical protein JOS54_00960 [Bulleidia sp. zg-1006]
MEITHKRGKNDRIKLEERYCIAKDIQKFGWSNLDLILKKYNRHHLSVKSALKQFRTEYLFYKKIIENNEFPEFENLSELISNLEK